MCLDHLGYGICIEHLNPLGFHRGVLVCFRGPAEQKSRNDDLFDVVNDARFVCGGWLK